METKVSVILPIYNAENFIDKAVHSVVSQTYAHIEVILIDDGSTDQSLIKCQEWQRKDPRIIVYHQDNQGVSVARNKGIDLASGEYILFVDSDDYIELDTIESLLSVQKNTEGLVVFGYFTTIQSGKVIGEVSTTAHKANLADLCNNFWAYYKLGITNSPVNKLFRADIIKEHRINFPPNIRMGEDLLFNIQYFNQIDYLEIIDQSYYHYMAHNNQATVKVDLNISNDMIPYLNSIKEFILQHGADDALAKSDYWLYVFRHLLTAMEMAFLDNSLDKASQIEYIKAMIEQFNNHFPKESYQAASYSEKALLKLVRNSDYRRIYNWFKTKYHLRQFRNQIIRREGV